jgi:hypothetical protein
MSNPTAGTLTDAGYYAWLPPAVAALHFGAKSGPFAGAPYNWLVSWAYYRVMPDQSIQQYSPESLAAADVLLTAAKLTGWPIDYWIMILNQSPERTMEARVNAQKLPYGPAYPNGQYSNPNDPMPGVPSNFPSPMPAGWLLYSTDEADFPPYPVPVKPVVPVIWTPIMSEEQSAVDPTTGLVHYFFGFSSGQNPPLGTPCLFNGLTFVSANVPGTDQNMFQPGVYEKSWMLTGSAG